MKKLYYLLVFLLSTLFVQAQTVMISSSIWSNEISTETYPNSASIPFGTRKVHIINNVDSFPELAMALPSAELIFSQAMEQENIDLVDINAELLMVDTITFVDKEICKVAVEYSGVLAHNPHYAGFSLISSSLPIIFPVAMVNQTTESSNNIAMHIYLNPDYTYHCSDGPVPTGEFDMITILLRALAIGCGLQSSLDVNTMQMGVIHNGMTCITPFDALIHNATYNFFADVVSGDISIGDFLINQAVYVDGYDQIYGSNPITIKLFNDWEGGYFSPLSSYTFSTIDNSMYTDQEYEDEFQDLLDVDLRDNASLREVTRYTMALLRALGWMKTIPVGYNDPYEPLYTSTLHCSGQTLYPNTLYTVNLSSSGYVDLSNVVCKLSSIDSTYVIGNVQNYSTFSYSSIPENVQWLRHPVTKNIIGEMHGDAFMHIDNYVSQHKTCYIEIPHKPNRPIIQKSESTDNGTILLHLNAFANGSDTYTFSYTGITNNDSHTFTITADALDTILTNIPATQLYNASVYGSNHEGNSDSYNFTFGFSAHPTLTLRVVATRTYLIYDLSNNGQIDISDVVISSVQIRDIHGLLWMNSNAGSGDVISITSLPRGRYVLTVVADGQSYSRMFVK